MAAANAFGAFLDVHSAPLSDDYDASRRRSSAGHRGGVARHPSNADLDAMQVGIGAMYTGPTVDSKTPSYQETGLDAAAETDNLMRPSPAHKRLDVWPYPDDRQPPFSSSQDASVEAQQIRNAAHKLQSWNDPPINKWRLISACLCLFGNGMNDAAPGALIPYMETHYHIGYAIVSTIFIANAVGFILAAFLVTTIDSRLGRAKTLALTESICALAYLVMSFAPPFPVFAVCLAVGLALNNVFVANLNNATVVLGYFHGSYGIGGLVAPIMATALVTSGVKFSYFYFVLVGLRIMTAVLVGYSFWHYERDTQSHEAHELQPLSQHADSAFARSAPLPDPESRPGSPHISGTQTPVAETPLQISQADLPARQNSLLRDSLRNRTTLIGALFIFAYQGAEVNISGWVISFLIHYRNGDPAHVGYSTAGFWGGISLGRLVLSYPAHRIGEKVTTYGMIVGAVCFQLLVWFVPNVVGNSVAIAFLGLLLGPIYPCTTTVLTRLLPRHLQHTALAFISSAGSSGGALAPFATGLIAQSSGTWVLNPICIGLFVVMLACWTGLPKVGKRRE